MNNKEVNLVAERYSRRNQFIKHGQYSMLETSVLYSTQERQRALVGLLKTQINTPLEFLRVLEVGCGGGGNLLELMRLGFKPENLAGNELLPERIKTARKNLPLLCDIQEGDASLLDHEPESIDIVYQSTVFTSLLDNDFQKKLASEMWLWVKPGGGVLWYDFIYNNPNNKDVRGVSLSRIKELFPDADITTKKITLAPPISRKVTKVHPFLYTLFNSFPFLRTHVLCFIKKPELLEGNSPK